MSQLTNIYVLKLKNNKYYIGQSQNVNQRIKQHERGEGSAWTQKYEPTKLIEVRKNVSAFDEDKITKEYMAKYGVENVRGGSYSQVRLSDEQEEMLTREIDTATGACFRCGEKGHFANRCDAESSSDQEEESDEYDSEDDACYRCGRSGHWAANCYAKTISSVPKQTVPNSKKEQIHTLMKKYNIPGKNFVLGGDSEEDDSESEDSESEDYD